MLKFTSVSDSVRAITGTILMGIIIRTPIIGLITGRTTGTGRIVIIGIIIGIPIITGISLVRPE
jgi:hypothetical protein